MVTAEFRSPREGQIVAPGTPIPWEIWLSVDVGDNLGLAAFVIDVRQVAGNPAAFDLPHPTSVPAAMANFAAPQGFSNPADVGTTTGYFGTLAGPAGTRNLSQVGGAQNTLGLAGSVMGLGTSVVTGIGQSGAVTVVQGVFPAPAVPGVYQFQTANFTATVLREVRSAPEHSTVFSAAVHLSPNLLRFVVDPGAFARGEKGPRSEVTTATVSA